MTRPLKFQTPEELETRINEYFDQCDAGEQVTELSKRGELVTYIKPVPYTIEGLALHLQCDPQTIRNYGKREPYFGIISHARVKVFNSWVKQGLTGTFNPKIVALCLAANAEGYNVRQEVDHKVSSVEDILKRLEESRHQGQIGHQADDVTDGELIE